MINTSIYIIRITSNFELYYMLNIVLSTFHSFIQQLIKHLIGAGSVLDIGIQRPCSYFLVGAGETDNKQFST